MGRNSNASLTVAPYLALYLITTVETILFDRRVTSFLLEANWLVWDYSWRILELGIIILIPVLRNCAASSFGGLRRPGELTGSLFLRVGVITFLVFVANFFFSILSNAPLLDFLPDTKSFDFPTVTSDFLKLFDLTFGLLLVAVNEEILFRSTFKCFLEIFTKNKILIVLVSSAAFSLSHWSLGTPHMVSTFFIGVILMLIYLRMGSIIPCMVAHYVMNFYSFYTRYYVGPPISG